MRRLFGFLIVIALLLVAADRLAWFGAERGLAIAIQDDQNLAQRPDVSVRGFPFLTQAFRGKYDQVDGTVRNLTVQQGVTIDALDVRLQGVHVTLGDLLHQRVTSAPVDKASAEALVGFPALDAAAKANLPDNRLKAEFGPGKTHDQLSVVGTYTSPLLNAQVNGEARVSAEKGALVVSLLPATLDSVPEPIRSQIVSLLGTSYKLPDLPFGFQARTVGVGADGVRVRATAKKVALGTTAS